MNFMQLANKRFSVRKFDSKPVEEEKLQQILAAGQIAPTARNDQPQRLLVLREQASLERLKKAANVYGAQMAIVVCGDHNHVWKRSYDGKEAADIDTSIVTTYMMLQATELGLGTIWVCNFNPTVLREEFNFPIHIEPISILGIGYTAPDCEPSERHASRKPLPETVCFDSYSLQ